MVLINSTDDSKTAFAAAALELFGVEIEQLTAEVPPQP